MIKKLIALQRLSNRLNNVQQITASAECDEEKIALNWAISEISKYNFKHVSMLIGPSTNFATLELEKSECNNITVVISIEPSVFENSLLRRYCASSNEAIIKDIPTCFICDKYYKDNKVLYLDGFVSQKNLVELGNKGIKLVLEQWLRTFYKSA
jgi:hypothetical protein